MHQVEGVKFSDIWDVGIWILTFGMLAVDIGDDPVSPRLEESS